MFKKLIAKVQELQQRYEAWNYKEYDNWCTNQMNAELQRAMQVDKAAIRIQVWDNSKYGDWYRKMLAIKEARQDARLAILGAKITSRKAIQNNAGALATR